MDKKKIVLASLLVAGVALGGYQVGVMQKGQASKSNRIAYVEGVQASTAKKAETETPDQVSAREGIAAEQIVVKITDKGYVTSHGDHYHYYNGKVPFDAIISEELLMKDPSYQLQQEHIVNEVKDGYIIKVDGRYYLYLKDKNKSSNVRTKEEIEKQKHMTATDGPETASSRAAKPSKAGGGSGSRDSQGRYKTDDGYVFNPHDVIEDTGDGFIVPHGNHFHFIPKSDLSPSELAAAQAYWNSKKGGGAATNAGANGAPEVSAPRADVPLGPTGLGAFAQPHTSPLKNGGTAPANKPANPGNHQAAPEYKAKDLASLLAELYALPLSKRYVEADGLVFDPTKISKRTNSGVVLPHGDHFHFIPYSKLSELEKVLAKTYPIGSRIEVKPDRNAVETQPSPKKTDPAPKVSDKDQSHHDRAFDPHHVLAKDEDGYMVEHGDHAHYFFKKDLTSEQIAEAEAYLAQAQPKEDKVLEGLDAFSRDASDQEKKMYISKTYGVPLEAIKISNGFFVFNNPDQAYDPTHIHPYAVRREHVRIPLETGDEELDFLNELYTTALRSGVSPYTLQVENGNFVIPHGDHNHYIKVQSRGLKKGLAGRIPSLQGALLPGDFDQASVLAKIQELQTLNRKVFGKDPLKERRNQMALGALEESIKKLPSNSTEGYLKLLQDFAATHIYEKETGGKLELSKWDKAYQGLVDRLSALPIKAYGLSSSQLLADGQKAKKDESQAAFDLLHKKLDALEAYSKRTGIEAVEALKLFYLHADDARLTAAESQELSELAILLYKSQASIEATDLTKLFPRIFAAKEVLAHKAVLPDQGRTGKGLLERERIGEHSAKVAIYEFLHGLYGDFAPVPSTSTTSAELASRLEQVAKLLERVSDPKLKESAQSELEKIGQAGQQDGVDLHDLLLKAEKLRDDLAQALERADGDKVLADSHRYELFYQLLMKLHRHLEDHDGSDADFDKVDELLDQLPKSDADYAKIWYEIQALNNRLIYPDRAGKANSQIEYSDEEWKAAKSAGIYTTEDGYIFDAADMTEDLGEAFIAPHMNHSHYIPKEDLSIKERQAASEAISKLPKKEDQAKPDQGTGDKEASKKERAEEIFKRAPVEKRIPLEQMPNQTAYTVAVENGMLIIPHYDHYHNLRFDWYDQGIYNAPQGYSLEDLFASVKYYMAHPDEVPHSQDGWGRRADKEEPAESGGTADSRNDQEFPVEEKDSAPSEEGENVDDPEEVEWAKKAQAFGMDLKSFRAILTKLALKYGIGLDQMTLYPTEGMIGLPDPDGQIKKVPLQ